ncbi:hypothetical protein IscW_ISCW003138 [Ixodes scapularis]|uniref:Uncharacterized protein n=1 Tax=Ixodes scapularis TaxID=6945 RepID=B7P9V3_IXOSC|nr:hypothetical protein IscW_ISCW003138 [Ixodes scapularis]|eukprot:XP_002405669.1 hypothetical protein IscW_ISCW003138 [Ixodes scapularis]
MPKTEAFTPSRQSLRCFRSQSSIPLSIVLYTHFTLAFMQPYGVLNYSLLLMLSS